MKKEIFEKMIEYGWNLNDNKIEDFEEVYDVHYEFIDKLYYTLSEQENDGYDLSEIDGEDLLQMAAFIGDFMRALKEIDAPKTKEDKIRDYITSRNMQYDLVGQDLLAILNGED